MHTDQIAIPEQKWNFSKTHSPQFCSPLQFNFHFRINPSYDFYHDNAKTSRENHESMRKWNFADLHIMKIMNMMSTITKQRSRKRFHLRHLLSRLTAFSFVIAPHQAHLKAGAYGETNKRSPQPQHGFSWSSLTDVMECSSCM